MKKIIKILYLLCSVMLIFAPVNLVFIQKNFDSSSIIISVAIFLVGAINLTYYYFYKKKLVNNFSKILSLSVKAISILSIIIALFFILNDLYYYLTYNTSIHSINVTLIIFYFSFGMILYSFVKFYKFEEINKIQKKVNY